MQYPPSPTFVRHDPEQGVTHITIPDPLGQRLLDHVEGVHLAVRDGDLDTLVLAAAGLSELLGSEVHVLPVRREAA